MFVGMKAQITGGGWDVWSRDRRFKRQRFNAKLDAIAHAEKRNSQIRKDASPYVVTRNRRRKTYWAHYSHTVVIPAHEMALIS